MSRVITDRPRRGGAAHAFRERRNELKADLNRAIYNDNYDHLHYRESYRHWASYGLGYDRKELNENLNPLKRYLRSQVGRLWDQVFSEMSEVMDVRTATQLHIWQHAKDDVETRTFIGDDGEVWYADDHCFHIRFDKFDQDWHRPVKDSLAEVYVDPRDGKICLVPKKPRYRYNLPKIDYVEIDKWHQAHKIWGYWFLVELAPIPQPYWKSWTEVERAEMQARLISDRAAGRWSYYSNVYRGREFLKSAKGRWIEPTFHDVAYSSIVATCREEYVLMGKQTYNLDRFKGKDIYGRDGVYACKRKQMNSTEIVA